MQDGNTQDRTDKWFQVHEDSRLRCGNPLEPPFHSNVVVAVTSNPCSATTIHAGAE